jgi:mannose-1-phosphate guanylyltransferase
MEFIRIAVIMAGGSGERFWPLSRQARPKQLLRLTSPDRTMLEESIGRIAPLVPPGRIYVATSRALVAPIRQAGVAVPEENVIGEPCKRNTAGALVYAAAQVLARHGEENAARISMAVLTADHQIDGVDGFRATAEAALAAAEQEGALVTIGIPPSRPETGYGYIETPEGADAGSVTDSASQSSIQVRRPSEPSRPQSAIEFPPVFPVARFREKPDLAAAREGIATGRFYWNSGMFFWRLDRFLAELERSAPAHAAAARAMAAAIRAGGEAEVNRIFESLEDISIDYALMEKARNVKVVRAAFGWDDVGAWDALDRAWAHDAAGNVTAGDPVLIDTRDSIVYNEPGAAKMAVAVIGVEGLAVVVSPDGVLVVPKERAQDVKKAVAELKKRGAGQL